MTNRSGFYAPINDISGSGDNSNSKTFATNSS